MKIAYVISRYPHRYQTFIRREINEVVAQGAAATVFPLVDTRPAGAPEVEADCRVDAAVRYTPVAARATRAAGARWRRERPGVFRRTLAAITRVTWRRPGDLAKSWIASVKGLAIAEHVASEACDHIHAHWSTHPATAALTASALTGVPFSFAFHAYDIFATRIMIPEKIRRAAFAVANCRYTLDCIRRLYPEADPARLVLLYNGVDPALFEPAPGAARAEPPLILAIGQLVPTKGFLDLVAACQLLAAGGVRFQATLIGAGPQEAVLRAAIRRAGLAGAVRLAGEQPQEIVRRRLAEAAVLAMPSVTPARGSHDGLPNVVIEAQAAGLPVVATRVFGIPELVEQEASGLLVPERDPAALRDALARLLADPALGRAMGARGRERVRERFDVHANCRELLRRFEAAARRHAPPREAP